MGLKISNNGVISMYRGDSILAPVYINYGTKNFPETYYYQPGDTLQISIGEPNQDFEDALIRKVIDLRADNLDERGFIIMTLDPEDT